MENQNVATYLNNHLAGATMGVELLKHLRTKFNEEPLAGIFDKLQLDVEQDRQALKAILARAGIKESEPRKAVGWLAEKSAQVKLHMDDPKGGALEAFEMLEAMSLGVEGKRSLWLALEAASAGIPNVREFDLLDLRKRAETQRAILEELRLKAAIGAFTAER